MGVSFLTFGGKGFLRLGIRDLFVWWLVFLRLRVKVSYVWGFGILTFEVKGFLCLGVSNSYVWRLVFLRLRVRDSYVWGLVFLRLGLSFLTFRG